MDYPRRLIEVDLPIKRISAHARREKSIRHGHISTLHIWWARRPLAACRAVICASLWPDPADPLCPAIFRQEASRTITEFAKKVREDGGLLASCSEESGSKFIKLAGSKEPLSPSNENHMNALRYLLLDFIGDFSNWDNSIRAEYLDVSRSLTQVAHESLGGIPGSRPLVVDPFAGGGSIPLEALRVGADAFASDLNPVAVLINKVLLEYVPNFGRPLADAILKKGDAIRKEAEKRLTEFYRSPTVPIGSYTPAPQPVIRRDDVDWSLAGISQETPIAYLWARTIRCEGPGCGAQVPLMRSLFLANKGSRSIGFSIRGDSSRKTVELEIRSGERSTFKEGTVKRGSATCPLCGFTTPVNSIRKQLQEMRGGANTAKLIAVVCKLRTLRQAATSGRHDGFDERGRFYRLPVAEDFKVVQGAASHLTQRLLNHSGELSPVPNETISLNEIRRISLPIYGMTTWGDAFLHRQALALITFAELIRENSGKRGSSIDNDLTSATQTALALVLDRLANTLTSLSRWHVGRENVEGVFSRQAISMVWDFAEANPFSGATGCFSGALDWVTDVIARESLLTDYCKGSGHVHAGSATDMNLPDNSAEILVTDPPYYDAVPYAYLSDFFYVWLRRSLTFNESNFLSAIEVPKEAEIVVDRPHRLSSSTKDLTFYEEQLQKAFSEGRRVLKTDGVSVIVFASKTTSSWEAIVQALLNAGWAITASWPIDTEMENRISAHGQARLASSVHIVCRPRNFSGGNGASKDLGDWRDILRELPDRVHEWMPRLAAEGIVGADAIFACLGPALEIFSRHSKVERASGEEVTLREYLEHVWAAVANEALNMIFKGADATGFEEDARVTAMWLWTLSTGTNGGNGLTNVSEHDEEDEEANGSKKSGTLHGFSLEYDAARKIAQGLGAHLEQLLTIVEVKGDQARLVSVAERAAHLFGKDEITAPRTKRRGSSQLSLFAESSGSEEDELWWDNAATVKSRSTVLDRIHQSMLLFAAARTAAMKRLLTDTGAGIDPRFWRLAQALSALYPKGTDEKRWIDGVLARKKSLGF